MKDYYVYILQSQNKNVLYVGVTNNLIRRLYEHQGEIMDGFSKKYKCKKLVYFEITSSIESAILREKQIKHWSRTKKDWLISIDNPDFLDLSTSLEMTY